MFKWVDIDLNPDRRTLRHFGFIALAALSLLSWCAHQEVAMFRFGLGAARLWVSAALLGVGLFCAIASFIAPQANRAIYIALSIAFFPIGWLVSHLLLAALFFCIIGPIAILVRLFARDPMQRGYDRNATSYFVPVKPRDKTRYFRQF